MLLELDDIHVFYGQVEALKGVTLGVDRGEIVALIGANGAGKTTTLKMISGVRPARRGRVHFDGADITKLAGHLAGLARALSGARGERDLPRHDGVRELGDGCL